MIMTRNGSFVQRYCGSQLTRRPVRFSTQPAPLLVRPVASSPILMPKKALRPVDHTHDVQQSVLST